MLITGCTSEKESATDVTWQTINMSLQELVGDKKVAFVNVGNIENGYFRKKLIEIKYDVLKQNKNLDTELIEDLSQTINGDFKLELPDLENTGGLKYYRQGVDIDSLLGTGILAYELGYSKAQVHGNKALYYIELIDPSHRVSGAGFLFQLQKEKDKWHVNSKVKGWEMDGDKVQFFFDDVD